MADMPSQVGALCKTSAKSFVLHTPCKHGVRKGARGEMGREEANGGRERGEADRVVWRGGGRA